MRCQSRDEVMGIESFPEHFVQQHHGIRGLVVQKVIHQAEIVFIVQYVQVFNHSLVGDVSSREAGHLVEDGKCVTHTSVRFLGNDGQGFRLGLDAFFLGHVLQVSHGILHVDAVEVINLASAQDGRQNLMLLGGGQNEDGMMRRLLQRFQESIEGRLRKHVNLVDDIYLIFPDLRRDAYLVYQGTDVLHRVVRSGIQFVDVVRALLVECQARFALVACLSIGFRRKAIDGFGKNTGTSGLAHTARTAEQVGMSQLAGGDSIFQGSGQGALSYHRIEGRGTVFTGRYDIVFHRRMFFIQNCICKCT